MMRLYITTLCVATSRFFQLPKNSAIRPKMQQSAGETIWTGHARVNSVILSVTLLGLILDSTGFAKPKVHAEGRLAS